ncbi:hypothetical protein Tco_1505171 [Tanacetum coccineum]
MQSTPNRFKLPLQASLTLTGSPITWFRIILQEKLNQVVMEKMKDARSVQVLNEIEASLGWRVFYAWVGDHLCGDSDLPAWSGVTCSAQGDYRVVSELCAWF